MVPRPLFAGDFLVPVAVVAEAALIGLIIWVVAWRLEQKARLRAELQLKLLERFSSVQELEHFLNTETGRRFLGVYAMKPRSPLWRIIGAAQAGVALAVAGLGVFLIGIFGGDKGPTVIGMLIVAAGAALLAAAATGRRLVKAWDVDREQDRGLESSSLSRS
jgi:hypothetical protein